MKFKFLSYSKESFRFPENRQVQSFSDIFYILSLLVIGKSFSGRTEKAYKKHLD